MERQEFVAGPNNGDIMKTTIKTLAAAALMTLSVSAIAESVTVAIDQPATLKGIDVVCTSRITLLTYFSAEQKGMGAEMVGDRKDCRYWPSKGERVTIIDIAYYEGSGAVINRNAVRVEIKGREWWTVEEELERRLAALKGSYVVCDSQRSLADYILFEDAGDTARMERLLENDRPCRYWHRKDQWVTIIERPNYEGSTLPKSMVRIEFIGREWWTVEEELEPLT